MPRSAEDNRQIRDARRDSILRAAERVFADKGFSFTKVSDIASAAGLSHGLVYHYFESKEALFGDLIEELTARIAEEFDESGSSARERLEHTLETAIGRVRMHPESMQLMTQAMLIGGLPESLRQLAFERARQLVERMKELVCDCQREGAITRAIDAEQVTSVVACVLRGMSIRPPGGTEIPMPMPTVSTLMALLQPSARDAATRSRQEPPRQGQDPHAHRKI